MIEPLTICTWLWRQPGCRTRYTAEHVNTWARMVSRHLTIPHRLLCLTDNPKGIEIETAPAPDDFTQVKTSRWSPRKGYPQCYRRLALFRSDIGDLLGPRFVSMDLDCVVFGSLDPLFDRDEDLVLFRGTGPRRPYNGSMMLMSAGARPHVYDEFTPAEAEKASKKHLGSDQGWLAYKLGANEATWRDRDGAHHHTPRIRKQLKCRDCLTRTTRILFFPGRVKPWDLQHEPAIEAHYR